MDPETLDAEDRKIVVLARGARLRAHAPHTGLAEGAAVRDTDGRTYAAATVENADPTLTTSALRGAVAAAASSGVRTFEAAALVTDGLVSEADLAVVREFGVGVPVHVAGPDGVVRETLRT
ncbi:MAG: cytidine deaminase [Actinomycetota bacterium]|nr:cytidine deaminase [Actinomycetota bacterium]